MDDVSKYASNAATTAALMEAGIALMRQNLRRRYASAGPEEIDARLGEWLRREADAIPGDTAGAVRIRERIA